MVHRHHSFTVFRLHEMLFMRATPLLIVWDAAKFRADTLEGVAVMTVGLWRFRWVLFALAIAVFAGPAQAEPPERSFCSVPYWKQGFPEWLPVRCSFVAPTGGLMIIDGLPPGTTIEADPLLFDLTCLTTPCEVPGGNLGGTTADFTATLRLYLTGTGDLSGYSRVVDFEVSSRADASGFVVFNGFSSVTTDFFEVAGATIGDPDFESLQITAGTGYGLPSPGRQATEPRSGAGKSVSGFVDLSYQIDFVGAPGGALDGLSGSTQGTVRLEIEKPPEPAGRCEVEDRGDGTADLPPSGCWYLNRGERLAILDGLPPGTTLEIDLRQSEFECDFVPCGQPGGILGGETETFGSQIVLSVLGTGQLAGYERTLALTADQVDVSGPRTPGDAIQHFPAAIDSLSASLAGDPDFSSLTLTTGASSGLESPGITTITDEGDGIFVVDSFFDVSYRIEFSGAPGGALEGLSGTTTGRVGMTAGVLDVFSDGFESGNTIEWMRWWLQPER
jgi:hypothetical protein